MIIANFANDLAESVHDGLQGGAEVDGLARRDAAEDFDLPHGGEAQVFERGFTGPGLNENAAELRQRLDHEHTGHERGIGKMTAQKFLTAFELPHGLGRNARNEFGQRVNETKFRAVWKGGKRLDKIRCQRHAHAITMEPHRSKREESVELQ